jgi:hypothetical protein
MAVFLLAVNIGSSIPLLRLFLLGHLLLRPPVGCVAETILRSVELVPKDSQTRAQGFSWKTEDTLFDTLMLLFCNRVDIFSFWTFGARYCSIL